MKTPTTKTDSVKVYRKAAKKILTEGGYCCPKIAEIIDGENWSVFHRKRTDEEKYFADLFRHKPNPHDSESMHGWWGVCSNPFNQECRIFALLLAAEICKHQDF